MPVVDTSYLIALQQGDDDAVQMARLLEDGDAPLLIPAIVWLEFLVGFTGRARAARRRFLRDRFLFCPVDEDVAESALRLQDGLKTSGRPMAWADLLIAATAMHVGEPVLTAAGDFEDLPDLEVLRP